MNCTRKSQDPLLQQFLRMRINPFWIAREQSPIGAVYVIAKRSGARPDQWRAENAFSPSPVQFEVFDLTTAQDQVLESTLSNKLEAKAGTELIASRIPGLPEEAKAELRAALEKHSASSISLRLTGVSGQRLYADDLHDPAP